MNSGFHCVLISFLALAPVVLPGQAGKDVALTTLGNYSGGYLYNTYVVIGAINDGYQAEAWDLEYVTDLLKEQVDVLSTAKEQTQDLLDSGFLTDISDQEFVAKIMKAFELLIREAKKLNAYVSSKSTSDEKAYQEARKEAWDFISELLGIENE